jgi:hypothetical protein
MCPRRLARPRTPPFHGGDMGSNPVGDAKPYQGFCPFTLGHFDLEKQTDCAAIRSDKTTRTWNLVVQIARRPSGNRDH